MEREFVRLNIDIDRQAYEAIERYREEANNLFGNNADNSKIASAMVMFYLRDNNYLPESKICKCQLMNGGCL